MADLVSWSKFGLFDLQIQFAGYIDNDSIFYSSVTIAYSGTY